MIRKLYVVFPYCPYFSNASVFHLSICYSLMCYLLQSFFGFPAHLQQITLPFCNFRIFGSRSSVSCIQLQGLRQSRICFLRTASGPTTIADLFPVYSFRAYGNPSLCPVYSFRAYGNRGSASCIQLQGLRQSISASCCKMPQLTDFP